ncbi:MAG: glycerate kinase [Christensenellales bacterium]
MRAVIATDSYKGCLSSFDVGRAMGKGLHRAGISDTEIVPIADGGEGFTEALLAALGGEEVVCAAHDALMRPIQAKWVLLRDGETAVIEMAACAGLPQIAPEERDPMAATTYGVGEILLSAMDRGAKRILLGLGGSATTDGGCGMARALGFSFLGKHGNETAEGGAHLREIASIDSSHADKRLKDLRVTAVCDVVNTLCGKDGAAYVFSPQKGANSEQVRLLDEGLCAFGAVLKRDMGLDVFSLPGGGAAGGLGAGAAAFLGANLEKGFSIVARETRLAEKIARADLVLTGEGRTDGQTASGKAPMGVAMIAKAHNVPCILLSGALGEGYEALYDCGVTAAFSVSDGAISLEDSMKRAKKLIERCALAVGRIMAERESR